MKRLLVFVFIAVFISGFSQSNGEMNFDKNKLYYNGEVINIKRAKEITKEQSPEAFKHFKHASIKRGFSIFCGVGVMSGYFVGFQILANMDPDNIEDYEAAGFLFFSGSVPVTYGSWGLWLETSRKLSIMRAVKAFNSSKISH